MARGRKSEYVEELLRIWKEEINPEEGVLKYERMVEDSFAAIRIRNGFLRAQERIIATPEKFVSAGDGRILRSIMQVLHIGVRDRNWVVLDWTPKKKLWGSEAEPISEWAR